MSVSLFLGDVPGECVEFSDVVLVHAWPECFVYSAFVGRVKIFFETPVNPSFDVLSEAALFAFREELGAIHGAIFG